MRTYQLILLVILSIGRASEGAAYGGRREKTSVGGAEWSLPVLDGRIIGGQDAEPGEFPFQVSVQHPGILGSYTHLCGGSVINDKYILTAAHCLDGVAPSDVRVVAGVIDLQDERAIIGVGKHIIQHENYNVITKANDIALLKLSEPLQLEAGRIEALELPNEGEVVDAGTQCTVVGWGSVTESGDTHNILQKLEVSVVADGTCKLSYGEAAIGPGMLCAGLGLGGAGACYGDQGSP